MVTQEARGGMTMSRNRLGNVNIGMHKLPLTPVSALHVRSCEKRYDKVPSTRHVHRVKWPGMRLIASTCDQNSH